MIKKILANNTLLKILSVFIAIVLWMYIIVVIDAPTEKTFREIPINTVNTEGVTGSGYCIEKLSVQSASVKMRGSRKLIANFNSENIIATLDMSEVNISKLEDDGVATVNLNVSSELADVVSFSPSTVDVHLETAKYKDVDIQQTESGDLLGEYVHGDITLSQNKVRIFGAQENIDLVDHAEVNVDFMNLDYSEYLAGKMTCECTVKLYDDDRNELDERYNRWIWIGSEYITAESPLYKTKTVPINADADGTLAGVSFDISPREVTVYGDNTAINGLDEVLTKSLTLTDFANNGETTVQISLPEWAKTVEDISEVRIRANTD